MERREWRPTDVCNACRQIFENAVPGPLSDQSPDDGRVWYVDNEDLSSLSATRFEDGQAWHFEGLPSLHGSMEAVYASALTGCIVCALISRMTRSALDRQKHLVDLAIHKTSMTDSEVDYQIQIAMLNEANKKRDQVRSVQRDGVVDQALIDLDRLELSLSPSGSYSRESNLSKIRSLGHASHMHHAFELQIRSDGSNKPMYTLLLSIRTAISLSKDWLHIVEWTDIHDHAASSQAQFDSSSPETIVLARQWLANCQRTHSSCNASNGSGISSTFVPTRLMKLEGLAVRLIDSSSEPPNGGYVTLSHCWGTERFFTLSTSTLSDLQKGMPIASFPSSFSDAMTITQNMGFGYMWIDCYCILQGDDEASRRDWDAESQLMHLVYTNSAFTIGASLASSPYEGCFVKRSPEANNFALLEWSPTEAGPKQKFRVSQHDGVFAHGAILFGMNHFRSVAGAYKRGRFAAAYFFSPSKASYGNAHSVRLSQKNVRVTITLSLRGILSKTFQECSLVMWLAAAMLNVDRVSGTYCSVNTQGVHSHILPRIN